MSPRTPGENRQIFALQVVVDVLDKRFDALRIVPAVDDEQRLFAHELETTGPLHGFQTRADRLVGEVPAARFQRVDRRENDCRVVQLMFAEQRQLQVLESSAGEDLTGKTVRLQADRIEVRLVKPCANLPAARFKHRLHRTGCSR